MIHSTYRTMEALNEADIPGAPVNFILSRPTGLITPSSQKQAKSLTSTFEEVPTVASMGTNNKVMICFFFVFGRLNLTINHTVFHLHSVKWNS